MVSNEGLSDDPKIKSLQKKALESSQLAVGKINFLAQHAVINPLALMESRMEMVVEFLVPSHVDEDGKRIEGGPIPTNPKRLLLDTFCNEQTIKKCDEAMGQSAGGLHVVKGMGDNGLH